jgi:hypothetical protein
MNGLSSRDETCIIIGCLLDVERIAVAGSHHLVVLFLLVLHHQLDLVLQTEQEQDALFPRHSVHFHVVDLEDPVAGHQAFQGGRTARLDGRHVDAHLVAARHADAHRSFLLETDEPRLQPANPTKQMS